MKRLITRCLGWGEAVLWVLLWFAIASLMIWLPHRLWGNNITPSLQSALFVLAFPLAGVLLAPLLAHRTKRD